MASQTKTAPTVSQIFETLVQAGGNNSYHIKQDGKTTQLCLNGSGSPFAEIKDGIVVDPVSGKPSLSAINQLYDAYDSLQTPELQHLA